MNLRPVRVVTVLLLIVLVLARNLHETLIFE
jgi:hypothetical protein